MAEPPLYTLSKKERICSRKALEELFSGQHESASAFPIRAVFMNTEEEGISVLFSVSKKFFKRAVHRNHIKRQMREAYRLQKHTLQPIEGGLRIAFLWRSNDILPTEKVIQKMGTLLKKIDPSTSNPI